MDKLPLDFNGARTISIPAGITRPGRSIKERIAAGRYDVVPDDIDPGELESTSEVVESTMITLVRLVHPMPPETGRHVLIEGGEYAHASPTQLLAIGESMPDLQREICITSLGSLSPIWVHHYYIGGIPMKCERRLPGLAGHEKRRHIEWLWLTREYLFPSCWVALVRRSATKS